MTAPAWPADQVTRRPLADLIPYARNARTHSPAAARQDALGSLRRAQRVPLCSQWRGMAC